MLTKFWGAWKRSIALMSVLAVLPLAIGCYGSFTLVRKVHQLNGDVSSDKWVQEIVFLLLNIPFVPVYSFLAALDAIFFNAVEFWTGKSVLVAEETRSAVGAHGELVEATFRPDRTVQLTITERSGERHRVQLSRRDDGTLVATSPSGELLATSAHPLER